MGDTDGSPIKLYYEEFTSLLQKLSVSLEHGRGSHIASSTSDDLDAQYEQASDCCQQLLVEVRSLTDSNTKQEWAAVVQGCKSQLQALRIQLDRHSLELSGGRDDAASSNGQAKDRLQSNEAALHHQNEALNQAMGRVRETEEVASGIMSELASNRATLESTKGKIGEVSSLTERANGLLKSMSKKWWR
jgi:chromosome segregation ATPase